MRLLRILLPLLVLLLGSTAARAQYNPTDPPEPGVYFTLSARAVPADGGYSISGAGTHAFGTNVRMSITTNTGYKFVGWEDEDGTIVSTSQTFTYVMPAKNVSLTARFVYDPSSPSEPSTPEFKNTSYISFQMNPSEGGYLSSGSAKEYEVGTTQTFQVRANTNYRFVNWTRNGMEIGTSSTLQFTVPLGDQTLVANFEYNPSNPAEPSVPNIPRTLTLKANPEGAASLSGGGSKTVGSNVSISASANTYYHFVNWTDEEGNVVSETSSFTYNMPDRHVTLTANYTYNYNPSSPGEPGVPNPGSGMAENMVLWPRFGMYDDSHVQILCETPGATIHYTLDGSTPNASSPVYTQPVYVGSNLLVKAIAYKEGMEDSPVVSYQVTAYKTATPVFTFENFLLHITSETPGATIRYTTDFSNPTEESDVYTTPFLPEENCRIKAYASKEGLTDSPINFFVFRRADYTIPAPTLSLNSERKVVITPSVEGGETRYTLDGSDPTPESPLYAAPLSLEGTVTVRAYTTHPNYYDSPVGEYLFVYSDYQVAKPLASYEPATRTVTMSCETEGASIRYTTNGGTPTATTGISYSEPFVVEGNKTFTIRAFRNDLFDSEVTTLEVNDQKVPTPTASFANRRLTLSCSDTEATIHYTLDGSEPTAESTRYAGTFELTQDCTVRFVAMREGFNDSDIAEYVFVYTAYQVAKPSATYDSATRTVTMSCETDGASIRYTTIGGTPTATTGIAYSEPFTVEGNQTFTVRAFRNDLFDSEVTTLEVNDQKVPTPTASFANRRLTLSCSDTEATIRYTLDGSEPTAESTRYSGAVELTQDCTVRFVAMRDGFNDSDIAEFVFVYASYQVAKPLASYDPATHTVTMGCDTIGASIRYTTNGEIPTATTGISYSEPFVVEGNKTFTIRAFRNDLFDSEVTTLEVNDQKVPTPTAIFANRRLTLSCSDPEATIRYTLDGSEPTAESTRYSGAFELTQDCTVRFIGVRDGFNDSDIAEFVFVYASYQVAKPLASYDPATRTVTMSCETEGASIRYTTNGGTPTATTGISYSEPFTVEGNRTFTVRAFRNDLFDSEVTTLEVNDQKAPTPTASFANRRLTLTCSDPEATIRYTLDGSEPTTESTRYSGAFELTQDCTVRFIAMRNGFNDSDIAEFVFVYASYQVAKPLALYDPATHTVTMGCETQDASIRYTTNGETPTATTGISYSEPFTVEGNKTFTIRAFRNGLFDSEVTTLEVNDQKVPTPTANFAHRRLTLICSDPEASIRYTIDGSEPTAESTRYAGAFELTADCTVRFIGVREGFNDSDIAEYVFVYANHQVAKPMVYYNSESHTVMMTCETEYASIRYTTTGGIPTATTGISYSEPFTVEGNQTFTVRAFRNDLFDSETTTYSIDSQKVPTPTASYARHAVELRCDDLEAQIRYTTDGSQPVATSSVYSEPIPMTGDCTVRFFAMKNGFNDSDENSYSFLLNEWQDTVPTIRKDFRNRRIYMERQSVTGGIRAVIDGVKRICNPIDSIDLDTNMHRIEFTSIASNADRYDSETVTEDLIFHLPPRLDYDGHAVHYGPADAEPEPAVAEASIYMDDALRHSGIGKQSYEIYEMALLKAVMESDHAFRSDTIAMPIDYYNTGLRVAARNGHRISEGFGTWGDKPEDYTVLEVWRGTIVKEDLEFLGTLPSLKNLYIRPTHMTSERCDGVFADSPIEVLGTVDVQEGLLKGMKKLTTLIWDISNVPMPNGRLTEAANPNILLWVVDADFAPEDAVNVIVMNFEADEIRGKAERITLTPGYPFSAGEPYRDVQAPIDIKEISLTKEFSMPTEIGVCAGWESIVLPFTPDSIVHESGDILVPISSWGGPTEPEKPFWLYSSNAAGWEAADTVKAGTPYIISMPNNPEYMEGYSLPGKVTFVAHDVTIGPDTEAKATEWVDGTEFVGTFMPVEDEEARSLNVNVAAGRDWLGSAFVDEDVTLPFGAYVRGRNLPRQIPVFGDWSGVMTPTADPNYGIMVETPAPGTIRVSAMRDCKVDIVSPDGALVRSLTVKAGGSVTAEGLTRGLYICAGHKLMVR